MKHRAWWVRVEGVEGVGEMDAGRPCVGADIETALWMYNIDMI